MDEGLGFGVRFARSAEMPGDGRLISVLAAPPKRWPRSSVQTPAPPIGAGSAAPPALPTASRSTATLKAPIPLPVSSATPVSRSQQPSRSACSSLRSTKKPSRSAPPHVSASLLGRFAFTHHLPSHGFARHALRWPSGCRRYGVLHCSLRSGLVRARHSRRAQPRILIPRHQPLTTGRLYPPHSFQSHSLGRGLKTRERIPFGFSPALFPLIQHAPAGARAEAVTSADSSLTSHNATYRY